MRHGGTACLFVCLCARHFHVIITVPRHVTQGFFHSAKACRKFIEGFSESTEQRKALVE